jgi:hypothetical protein
MSFRSSLIQYLQDAITAAAGDNALSGLTVNDTPARPYTANKGITVFFPTFNFVLDGRGEMKEYNGSIELLCYAIVDGEDMSARSEAYDSASEIAKEVARLFFLDASVGGAVCDATITDCEGGWDAEDAYPYQLIALTLRYNQIGLVESE